jgi:hypothetical protein
MIDAIENGTSDTITVTCRDPHCPAPDLGAYHRDYWNSFWAQGVRNEHDWRWHYTFREMGEAPRGPIPPSHVPKIGDAVDD